MKTSNLIIISLILFSFLFLFYFFQPIKKIDDLEIELENFNKGLSSNITEISNPVFKSKGLESNSYMIKADKGVQDEGHIELFNVKAQFEGEDNKLFYVSADKGTYNQKDENIELIGNVIILDELNNKTSTNKALIDIKTKKTILQEAVISTSDESYISSNNSIIDKINNTIIYSGNVKVKIENE